MTDLLCVCETPSYVDDVICGTCLRRLPTTEDLLEYGIPVYAPSYQQKQPGAAILDYVICEYCNAVRIDHIGEERKCLFAATTFKQLIRKKWYK